MSNEALVGSFEKTMTISVFLLSSNRRVGSTTRYRIRCKDLQKFDPKNLKKLMGTKQVKKQKKEKLSKVNQVHNIVAR